MYIECINLNRIDEAILMSTHNVNFISYKKRKFLKYLRVIYFLSYRKNLIDIQTKSN